MSVINQMLRDLDKRSASPLEPGLGAGTSARAALSNPSSGPDGVPSTTRVSQPSDGRACAASRACAMACAPSSS